MKASKSDSDSGMDKQSRLPGWQAAVFLLVAFLLLGGFFAAIAQWSPLQAEAIVGAPTEPASGTPGTSSEYFPDRYVNQGTRVDEPIQTF